MTLERKGFLTSIQRLVAVLGCSYKYGRAVYRNSKLDPKVQIEGRQASITGWGEEIMEILNIHVRTTGTPSKEPTLFIGNHISYLDIPLLCSRAPVVYVAKKELQKWPLFGKAMTSVGTVFVDRSSIHSRKGAADEIAPYIKQSGQSVAIFPSGTTTLEEQKPWRWGAFVLAKRHGIPIQPFRLCYKPRRAVAFIEDDLFPPHLWNLVRLGKIEAQLDFHEPILVDDPDAEAKRWWQWTREILT